MEKWMERNIWSISHLLDDNGNMYAYDDFSRKYNLFCTKSDYEKRIKRTPKEFVQLVKNYDETKLTVKLQSIKINGLDLLFKKCNNNFLRQYLTKQVHPSLIRRKFMEN